MTANNVQRLQVECPVTKRKLRTPYTLEDIREQIRTAEPSRVYAFDCPHCGQEHRMALNQLLSVLPKH